MTSWLPVKHVSPTEQPEDSRPVRKRPGLRFALFDAMILVAVTTAGLGWGRDDLTLALRAKQQPTATIFNPQFQPRPVTFADRLSIFRRGAARVVTAWTLALLILHLRPPRPRTARLLCQPGFVAVATATAYTVAVAVGFFLAYLIRAKYKPAWSDYIGQSVDVAGTAQAIAAAWLILALSRRWRSERNWTETASFAVGLAWIALWLSGNLFDWW